MSVWWERQWGWWCACRSRSWMMWLRTGKNTEKNNHAGRKTSDKPAPSFQGQSQRVRKPQRRPSPSVWPSGGNLRLPAWKHRHSNQTCSTHWTQPRKNTTVTNHQHIISNNKSCEKNNIWTSRQFEIRRIIISKHKSKPQNPPQMRCRERVKKSDAEWANLGEEDTLVRSPPPCWIKWWGQI